MQQSRNIPRPPRRPRRAKGGKGVDSVQTLGDERWGDPAEENGPAGKEKGVVEVARVESSRCRCRRPSRVGIVGFSACPRGAGLSPPCRRGAGDPAAGNAGRGPPSRPKIFGPRTAMPSAKDGTRFSTRLRDEGPGTLCPPLIPKRGRHRAHSLSTGPWEATRATWGRDFGR